MVAVFNKIYYNKLMLDLQISDKNCKRGDDIKNENNYRHESEMFNLILNVARSNERVRAVYLNGSRANPAIKKDVFQDFDIVYAVTETASFLKNCNWITVFGDIAMVQEPDNNDFGWGKCSDFSKSYAWLILFKDGNRIDLTIKAIEKAVDDYTKDSLTIPLLDKDGILPKISPSNDQDYHIKPPTLSKYLGCCNEFWWCLNNVAKGIARDELPYAMTMFNVHVREMLDEMVEWKIGSDTAFGVSAGKSGKYFKQYLPQNLYALYAKTYSNSDYKNLWEAVFSACELFRTLALETSTRFNLPYNQSDDDNMTAYLTQVRKGKIVR